jgi:hypothetical protein
MVMVYLAYIFYKDLTYNYHPFISEEFAKQYIAEKLLISKFEDVLFYKIIETDLKDEIEKLDKPEIKL